MNIIGSSDAHQKYKSEDYFLEKEQNNVEDSESGKNVNVDQNKSSNVGRRILQEERELQKFIQEAIEQQDNILETQQIYQVFDKIIKKVLTLSVKAVVNLINGLFDMDYPLDSTITYNWTEFEDDKLRKILADTILTINGKHSYHLEAQMEKDNSIVFRVFDYGFQHANRTRIMDAQKGEYCLRFPEPIVIYLYCEGAVPDMYTLKLERDDGSLLGTYDVPVVKVQEISVEELNGRKMVILLPFHALKLRKMIKNKKPDEDIFPQLKKVIQDDIIGSIESNVELGNINPEDGLKLQMYLNALCRYLSHHHKELEEIRNMTDESFITAADIICDRYEKLVAEKDKQYQEVIAEKDKQYKEALEEKDYLIAKLQKEIEDLTRK